MGGWSGVGTTEWWLKHVIFLNDLNLMLQTPQKVAKSMDNVTRQCCGDFKPDCFYQQQAELHN